MNHINPNTYSSLPPRFENLRIAPQKGGRLTRYRDESTGEIFFKITEAARTQFLVSKLLKGIIPVSDVVIVLDTETNQEIFLSKEMDLDAGEVVTDISDQQADALFLELVFNDSDHNDDLRHNIRANKERTNHFLFDFGEADQLFGEEHAYRHESVDEEVLGIASFQVRKLLRTRIETFITSLNKEDSVDFIAKILAVIPKEPVEGDLDEHSLHALLLKRAQKAIAKVQKFDRNVGSTVDKLQSDSDSDILKL